MATTTEEKFDRDQMARSYAQRHMNTDMGVMRVIYLPRNAPPREIRLLEINSLIPETTDLEPIDFGVDVGNEGGHTLMVLDVTPDQWEAIGKHQLALPNGWTLDGNIPLVAR